MKTFPPSPMHPYVRATAARQNDFTVAKLFTFLLIGLLMGWYNLSHAQVNITPVRTDVSGFGTWTDNNVAGTTYLQLLVANASTITPAMDFDSYSSEALNFKARTYGGTNAVENIITVSISTDNGSNWTILGTRTPTTSTLTAVTAFDLSAYNGSQVKIKIYVEGTSGTIGAGIDDITITGIPGNSITTTTPVTGSPFCVTPGSAAVSVPFTITGTYNSGNVFTAQLSNSSGSFTSPTDIGTLTSTTAGTISATIPSGTAAGSGYKIRVISSNPAVTGSMTAAFTVATTVVPSVSIAATATTICAGSSVTFTPTPVNGGTPTYQWKVNGSNTATGSTYATSGLVSGDVVSCVMSSTATCASPSTATSGNITMTVNPLPADPAGSITPAANPACTNTTISYSNAAATAYWETSASGTSTANPTTTPLTVSTSGTYYVRINNGSCWSANALSSAALTINAAPSVTVQPADKTVNEPATATFSVTATGTGLAYQWQLSTNSGGSWSDISGANASSYTTPASIISMNGYMYRCVVSGTAPCVSATSGTATLTVLPGAMWTNSITGTDPSTSNPYTTGQTFNSNITVSGISRGSGIAASSANDRYSASGWNSASLDANDYFEFTLTPNAGYQINFTDFIYNGQASGTGPGSFAFRSSLDSYGANIGTATVNGTTLSLAGAAYQGITSAITFRFYGWGASAGTGTYSINDFTFNGTVMPTGPLLVVNPATRTGFTYAAGSGPSTSQNYTLSGTNLTGAPGNITVAAPLDYEVSTDNSSFSSSVNIPYTSATLNATTVYVRLKAGLAAGTYNSEQISHTGGGAADVYVTCSGVVTGPAITVSSPSISGLSYVVGSGPSTSLSYSVSGAGLTPASGNLTLTAPAHYEISTDNSTFLGSLNLPYAASTLAGTTIYVRLISGLTVGTYNNETLAHSGGGASIVNVTLNGNVYDPAALPTVLDKGDFAILAVNTQADATGSADEISFVCFKDLNPGTTIYFTDNGYERVTAGLWGNTEGVVSITRTNAVLPKGTIITIHSVDMGINEVADFTIYTCGAADANWTKAVVSPGNFYFDLNRDDQVWFMQGGVWGNLGTGLHDATYTGGNVLYGWTDIDWKTAPNYASTKGSTIYPGLNCFVTDVNNLITSASRVKFDDPAAPDFSSTGNARLDWISLINDPAYWSYYSNNTDFYANGYQYQSSTTCPAMTIANNTYVNGKWTGAKNINWFECENWNTFVVPDETTNVIIPSTGVTNEPTIGDPPTFPVVYTGAECNDIDIQSARTLTMNHANSRLDVYNNWTQNGAISFTNGVVNMLDGNSSLSGSGLVSFYNLNLNKTASTSTLTLGTGITVQNILTMTKGNFVNGANVLELGTSPANLGTLNYTSGYVLGTMRRWFSGTNNTQATGLFPIGRDVSGVKNRSFYIQFTGSPSVPGSLEVYFNPVPMGTAGLPINNIPAVGTCTSSFNVTETTYEGYWVATPGAGALGDANYTLAITGEGFGGITDYCKLTLLKRVGAGNWTAPGTHLQPTATPTVSRSGLLGFSNFGMGTDNTNPLPIELLAFTAREDNGDVLLEWSTATERNNDRFVLERSANAKQYETIAGIQGAGNSNKLLNYSYLDKNPIQGLSYYRLLQYDFDGSSTTSDPVSIRLSGSSDDYFYLVNTANNGTNPKITYFISSNAPVTVNVYDVNGRLILSEMHTGDAGTREYIPVLEEGPGLYFIRLKEGENVLSTKILIR